MVPHSHFTNGHTWSLFVIRCEGHILFAKFGVKFFGSVRPHARADFPIGMVPDVQCWKWPRKQLMSILSYIKISAEISGRQWWTWYQLLYPHQMSNCNLDQASKTTSSTVILATSPGDETGMVLLIIAPNFEKKWLLLADWQMIT